MKRKIPQNEENSDDLEDELEKNEKGYKKVKVALEDRKVNFENTPQAPFYVKFIYDTSIQQSFSEENRINHSNPFGEDGKSNMLIKREQFARLPNETVMRLSKDHCNVLAVKQVSDVHYEIKDLSMNGIFFLGNSINKTMEHPPKRLSKLQSYSIKHGDLIGLLMKKDAPQELLLGFEFCATNF